ncbi:hypothetical protein O9G_000292 [Rozella allomycis CSF55]|uniref:Uncharacterized protein n=1 Tax=Rozella allomycis (strain CSF55) TaxID=988480 RepID=A0A075AP95_ROZAC|nr:hypothetical protein O9G_000292 [Rozella allomycis CSF55]|eukprot:EPZ31813.1 hypothetical protein O9G_000292 [Rozella allomycis CSF55]
MKFITEALSLSIMLQMALGASPVVPRSALASHNFNAIKNSNLAGRRLYGLRNRYQKGSLEFTDANGIVHNAKLLKIKDDYFAKVDNGKGKNVYTRLAEGKDGKIEFDTSKTISARRRALMKHSTKLAATGAGLAMFGAVAAIGGSSRDADEEKFKQEMEDYKKYQLQMAQISGAEVEKFAADPTDKSINTKTNPGGNAEVDNNALHLPNLDLDMDIESLTDLNHTPSSTHTTSGMATNNIADVSGNFAITPMGMGPNVGSQSSGMGSHIGSQSSMPNLAPLNSGAPGIPSSI